MWENKTRREAHQVLAQEDVIVTNQKDTQRQLPKLLVLDNTVRETMLAATLLHEPKGNSFGSPPWKTTSQVTSQVTKQRLVIFYQASYQSD